MQILSDIGISPRQFKSDIKSLNPEGLFIGQGNQAIEIISFNSKIEPPQGTLHQAYKERRGSRASPLLVVVSHPNGISLCGVTGDKPPIFFSTDKGQIQRLCLAVLKKPNRNIAINFISNNLISLEDDLPGIINQGLLSSHELINGTRDRKDWDLASKKAKSVVGKTKKELLTALGYSINKLDNLTEILKANDRRTAIAVFLDEDEIPETKSARFNNLSPISYALNKADQENIPWVILQQEDRIRLHSVQNLGVSRRGRSESYLECNTSLIPSDFLGILWLLFSSDALKKHGSINEIIDQSNRFAVGVAEELRERIYDIVIPLIAKGIIEARNLKQPTKEDLSFTYEMVITVLFRLLFIAYAEDRDLLPYKTNENYRKRSLKQKAIELIKTESKAISHGSHHWEETTQLFKAVFYGNKEWSVPAYEGSIFSDNPEVSKVGEEISKIKISNEYFELALKGLLLNNSSSTSSGPVDFRSLSVREFGTIYESLLESDLSLAKEDLTIDKKGFYIPLKTKEDNVVIHKNEIYLHDNSGARKSSGSYYTPDFAVEHLLDKTLEKALDQHFKKLEKMSDSDKAENFFDFRVADIAMGSGHFLVAAIDRIEKRFVNWLEKNPIPGVVRELEYLKQAAKNELGDLVDTFSIDDNQLMKRLIARRCIYGVDLNSTATQLSKLSIWIHTFVPGLPLSLLDHNLIHGNSLIGVASLEEIGNKFKEADGTLFEVDAESLLGQASEPLIKLAKLSDASIKDIALGRDLIEQAKIKTKETKALCDLIIAQPISEDLILKDFPFEDWENRKKSILDSRELSLARKKLNSLDVIHFPIVFPEVFLGKSKGFNVILGNPPWEEVKPEERDFWTKNFPGLRGLSQREQVQNWQDFKIKRPDLFDEWLEVERSAKIQANLINTGNYPGLETGDLDLYKAFCWRFWNLTSDVNGKIGVVLPRSVLTAKGSEKFRKELFLRSKSLDITNLQNTGRWIFDIHPQYTIVLASISKSQIKDGGIKLNGPYTSMQQFLKGKNEKSIQLTAAEVINWSDDASIPLLSSNQAAQVLRKIKKSPRLDLKKEGQWRARPDRQLDATLQKPLMDLDSKECPHGFWPVYKGGSFDLWEPDKGEYYAWTDPNVVLPWLQNKRLNAKKSSRDSVHKEFSHDYIEDISTLAPNNPSIAFRLITNRTNSRTMVCSLTPPNVLHSNSSQVIIFTKGDEKDAAFLLGVLSSIPLDWYARCFVELNFNFFIFNNLPIPRPDRENPLWIKVVELSARLASIDERFSSWAEAVGVEFGHLEENIKNNYICELDALISLLYSLKEDDIVHIFETFHTGWDYNERLKSVLSYYKKWSSSI